MLNIVLGDPTWVQSFMFILFCGVFWLIDAYLVSGVVVLVLVSSLALLVIDEEECLHNELFYVELKLSQ